MPCKKTALGGRRTLLFFTLQITAYKESYYKWNFIVLQKILAVVPCKSFMFYYNTAVRKGLIVNTLNLNVPVMQIALSGLVSTISHGLSPI